MPVIVGPDDYDRLLDRENESAADLADILAPFPAERMSAYPVSRYVSKPGNEGPECVEPIEL